MRGTASIDHVIFDFDGTCTDIPAITENFLRSYLSELNKQFFTGSPVSGARWQDALNTVRKASPDAGWTVGTTPSAPGAADPYILSYEAAQLLRREQQRRDDVPGSVFDVSDAANPAPLRPELKDVLLVLRDRGARVTFISNSTRLKIQGRLEDLFDGTIPEFVRIQAGGEKYKIAEPPLGGAGLSGAFLALFRGVPAAMSCAGLARPVYLRRASYAGAISSALGGDVAALNRTVFCGDIWEMDLALPFHLGARIHLIARAAPFTTYRYELAQIAHGADRARTSIDLDGLREWL
jgi:phosphoglycolate phosphatase-like HAD superfamily hydrolase